MGKNNFYIFVLCKLGRNPQLLVTRVTIPLNMTFLRISNFDETDNTGQTAGLTDTVQRLMRPGGGAVC